MWLNTMIGVSLERPATSFSIHHARDVEAVPAVTSGARAEGLAVLLAGVVAGVMLARHCEDVRRAKPGKHLLDLIELRGGGQMRQIAAVDDEIRCVAQAVYLVDGLAERVGHIRVGRPGKADVAVADLGEAQRRPGCLRGGGGGAGDMGDHLTAHDGQHNR
jgi:hypothetical protein